MGQDGGHFYFEDDIDREPAVKSQIWDWVHNQTRIPKPSFPEKCQCDWNQSTSISRNSILCCESGAVQYNRRRVCVPPRLQNHDMHELYIAICRRLEHVRKISNVSNIVERLSRLRNKCADIWEFLQYFGVRANRHQSEKKLPATVENWPPDGGLCWKSYKHHYVCRKQLYWKI